MCTYQTDCFIFPAENFEYLALFTFLEKIQAGFSPLLFLANNHSDSKTERVYQKLFTFSKTNESGLNCWKIARIYNKA